MLILLMLLLLMLILLIMLILLMLILIACSDCHHFLPKLVYFHWKHPSTDSKLESIRLFF